MSVSFLIKLLALTGAIALSYPPRVRVRATVKLSAAFFHDESSITIGRGGGTKVQQRPLTCNSINKETLAQVFSVNFAKFLGTPF